MVGEILVDTFLGFLVGESEYPVLFILDGYLFLTCC